jgi:amino-acid N-acetyltransferase
MGTAFHSKAESIRDVIRYLRRFRGASVFVHIPDEIIGSPLFANHIRDIALIHDAGLKIGIIPGAAGRIDEVLTGYNVPWQTAPDPAHTGSNCRITGEEAMPLIKMAAFDVANRVMTGLAAEKITAVIGNWVRARGKGIIDGVDYGSAGEVDRISKEAVLQVLDNGFIPIFPCIGWSAAGKPYNISSVSLASHIAELFQGDKLFFLTSAAPVTPENFDLPAGFGLSPERYVPAMDLGEVARFLALNNNASMEPAKERTIELLSRAAAACEAGVSRVHILSGSVDGVIPYEIFSGLGAGTMIYKNNYGGIRNMTLEDIPAVLSLMSPFVEQGILLPRTVSQMEEEYSDFIVYELDGGIRACAALHLYTEYNASAPSQEVTSSWEVLSQGEIAAVAVDQSCTHTGIGPKLLSFLMERAKNARLKSVFVLTTRTADWFEQQGFIPAAIESLPEKRRAIWNASRGSRLYRLNLI